MEIKIGSIKLIKMESRIDAKGIIEKTGAYITAREGDLLSVSAKKNPDMGDIVERTRFRN